MRCKNNPKKFLWIKYFGEHLYLPIRIWKFMDCSKDFCVRYQCKLCGAETEHSFVEWDELLNAGFTNEQIKKIGTISPFLDESLKIELNN